MNTRLGLAYSIKNDIPIMLIDKADSLDEAEVARVLAKVKAEGIAPTFVA